MCKIVHLITDLNTGGAEVMLLKILSNFDKSNFDNVVISLMDKGAIALKIEQLGIKVFTLGMKRGIPNPIIFIKLIKILKVEKPDILQTWLYHADFLGLFSKFLLKEPKLVWNIRCSNMELKKNAPFTAKIVGILAHYSHKPDAIIINSRCGLDYHRMLGYSSSKWKLIFNGFELDKFKPGNEYENNKIKELMGLNAKEKIIGTIARYDYTKGYDLLINAASILINSRGYRNIKFILIGKDVDEFNKQLVGDIENAGVRDAFLLLGERNDIESLIPIFDIYVSASISEGFPNVLGEALASGVPCVATDVGDSSYLVNRFGEVVAPGNAILLANAVERLLQKSEKDILNIGLAARMHIQDNFSISRIANEYENLYKSLLN